MDKFEEIIAHIKEELAELAKINTQLKDENEMLRERLGMPTQRNNVELSLEEAFNYFEVADDTVNVKMRAYNTLMRGGYGRKSIMQFEGISAYELLAIRNMGFNSLAIIILMMEYFGVSIEIPDIDCDTSMPYYQTLRSIHKHQHIAIMRLKNAIQEYRDRIKFKD